MGVIADHGPVGIVATTSKRYSKIISLYNIETSISAMVQSSRALGIVQWEPFNLEYVVMRDIPRHVEIEVGDTVVTSGYSFSFPQVFLSERSIIITLRVVKMIIRYMFA